MGAIVEVSIIRRSSGRTKHTAAHLVDSVLPFDAPVRQWVCSLPWQLRSVLGYDSRLCSEVMTAFATELMRSYKRRAKRQLGLASVADAFTGTITFVQRFDSALRLNVHGHTLALDGVYVCDEEGELRFQTLPEPTVGDVTDVATRTAARIERVLEQHGRYLDEPTEHGDEQLSLDYPALASCYQAATSGRQLLDEQPGKPALRLLGTTKARKHAAHAALVAEVRGVNVHAERVVDGRDRKQLERLCRYLARPPLSHERLSELADGKLRLALKTPWSDGTRAIVLSPMDLIARLCALVPPPYFHLTRFHGVFAPNATLRPQIVPVRAPDPELDLPEQLLLFDKTGQRPAAPADPEPAPSSPGRHPWAWLLKRVFKADVTVCPKCQGRMRITQVALTADDIGRILAHHGLGPRPPPPPILSPPGQLGLPLGS